MKLGRYHLLGPLGAIRDAVCYRAATEDGATVEVRVLGTARGDADRWAALGRRLRLAALLDHPAAVRVRELALDHDPPFAALDEAAGEPLRTALAARLPLPPGEAFPLTHAIAAALAAAHRLGLIHGDVSPDAVRATPAGQVQLDFTGLSSGGPEPSGPDDVRQLGALLTWLLTGDTASPAPAVAEPLLKEMLAADPANGPTARAVEERLAGAVLSAATVDSVAVTAAPAEELWASQTTAGPTDAMPAGGGPRVGDTLGRFRLVEKLGEGGMGAVFRAEDQADGQVVAVKVLRSDWAGRPAALRRFYKEARLLAEVNNPYVANFLEVNEDGGVPYLALEFVAGRSLDKLLAEHGRFEERDAVAILASVARALVEAHRRGIVHRDVKPENILLQIADCRLQIENPALAGSTKSEIFDLKSAIVKLSDFGLARHVVESESLMVTQAGGIVGTPSYMAPEQCTGRPTDPRTDVYAMGATLFHLLAGRPPFVAETPLALMALHCNEPPPALKKLVPGLTDGVCQVVEKSLAKAPEARYADAAALLRDLERVLRGEPTSILVHPRLPAGDPARVLHYDWTWELEAPAAQLWPYVSNTERLNRAVGLPAVQFTTESPEGAGPLKRRVRRFGRFRKAGLTAAWEEHPFEWVEAQRFGVLREYSQGPFKWLVSVVELSQRAGGGTTLTHRVRVEPHGLLGRTAAAVEIGVKGRRAVERVYRRIDAFLTGKLGSRAAADPFEEPAPLSGGPRRRLEHLLDRLTGRGVDPAVVERLGEFLAHAPAQEAARMRPLALARRWGLPADQVVAACLHGAREGLLVLLWDLLCPLCRIPSEVRGTLRALREHGHCPACALDFDHDFAQSVELIFRAHPAVRDTELGTYCVGGPAHSPHVVAQVRVAPGERIELDLALSEGAYQLRGPQLPYAFEFRVQPGAPARAGELLLAQGPGSGLPRVLGLGAQVLGLTNDHDQELLVRLERVVARDDALTAARAASLALFRELFPEEVLAPGQLVSVAHVALLLTRLDGALGLYAEVGDARAFALLHDHFRRVDACVRAEGGALVKTVGEGALAAFPEAEAAVRAALRLTEESAVEAGGRPLVPGLLVHRGPAMAATLNDHLDYFGATVSQALQLLPAVRGGELVLTEAVASDPQASALLQGRAGELFQADLPGAPPGPLQRYRSSASTGTP